MKTLVTLTFGLFVNLANAQTYSDKIVRELCFEQQTNGNALILANINGSIQVEGYPGKNVLIEITRHIQAKTESHLERAKNEIALGVINRVDTLIIYTHDGCNQFKYRSKSRRRSGNYEWNTERQCDLVYDYKTDLVVKLPYQTHLDVSTVNDGDILVNNVNGTITANNINGSIKLTALQSATTASTINGDVELEYAGNPTDHCQYYTLNGDINAWFKKGLAANLSFKSFNGELFSNVEQLESLPALLKKETNGKIKLSANQYKISKGGVQLDFETFNGNVYLREK